MATNYERIAGTPEKAAWILLPYECEDCVAGLEYCLRKKEESGGRFTGCVQVLTSWLQEEANE